MILAWRVAERYGPRMSAQPLPVGGTLRYVAAAEVRAELARQRKTSQALAKALGISPQAMSRRTTGDLPFDLDELEAAAAFLDVPITQLLGRREGLVPSDGKVASDAQRALRAVPSPRRVTLQPHSPRPLLRALPSADNCSG